MAPQSLIGNLTKKKHQKLEKMHSQEQGRGTNIEVEALARPNVEVLRQAPIDSYPLSKLI